ncbi:MAG: M28 family metallopeptidase [Allosphingosinicella sp.]|uniref:M28 family metallopeptidase n=1 Tax=Allosphingosinicella sp. TaxID=2823234 RepID=UPI00392E6688
MRFNMIGAAALFASLAACTPAQQSARTAGASAPQIPLATLQRVTEELASDAFEGRAPGTPGEEKTVELLSREFARVGLQPGNNGSWTQDVPLVEISARGAPKLEVRGPNGARTYDFRTDFVAGSYRAQPRIDLRDSEMVFVGYGINAPERGWNDYEGLDVRGKTVLILVNDPDWQSQTLDGPFGGRAMTYYGRWTYKYEEAARQGAAAALIIHQTEPASYGWNVVENSWTGPQLFMDDGRGGADQTLVNGWVTQDAARRILADAGQDLAALTARAQRQGFRPVPLGLTASTGFDNDIRRQASRNVIGILPGRTRPDEYILYTAHWDHLGICAEGTDNPICNGAIDNATGTAALVALAEAFAKGPRPDRSIVFLAVTAEESGLLGSAYYAANPVFPLHRTVGGINMDSLNMAGNTRDFVLIGAGKSELEDVLQPALARRNLVLTPEPSPEAGYFYRSDHFSFAKQGVPMLYGRGGEDLVVGGLEAGRAWAADYRANRYHGPRDEFDPNWDWSGAVRDLEIYHEVGLQLANSSAWPNWREGDEFRAIRDRSLAAAGR